MMEDRAIPGITIVLCALTMAALSLCARSELTTSLDMSQGDRPTAALWTIDLNGADVAEFDLLPGVGSNRSAMIVALRAERHGLSSGDDLRAVSGIGPITLHRIRPWVRCSPVDRSPFNADPAVVNAIAR
jgi:DNA uptake protein ComE-like DNA-binding protein